MPHCCFSCGKIRSEPPISSIHPLKKATSCFYFQTYHKVLAPNKIMLPITGLFFVLIPNLKKESIYLTRWEFYREFQFFVFSWIFRVSLFIHTRDISPRHRTLSIIWITLERKALTKNGFHRWIALKIRNKQICFEITASFGFKE